MKLYLSSYHLGNGADELKKILGPNKKAAIINNSLDFSNDFERLKEGKQREIYDLSGLGLQPEELDLRIYFGKKKELSRKLKEFGFIWVRGGNTFILRRAMMMSGFDEIIKEYAGSDRLVYGGYSAGVCVLTPTLKGLELVDEPYVIPEGYKSDVIWEGLGLINYCIAPHYKSDHPESEAVNNVVDYYEKNNIPFKTLRDGEFIIEEI